MPQVKNKSVDSGWYKNLATDTDGNARKMSLGVITFAPGQVRHVNKNTLLSSRSAFAAFESAMVSGKIVGPAESAQGPWGDMRSESTPAEVPDEAPVHEEVEAPVPEPVYSEEVEASVEDSPTEDITAEDKPKRKGRKNKGK